MVQRRPVPPGLAVALGEWLYNLRTSLDYVVWATACYVAGQVPPPGQGVLQYPIYDEESVWKRNEYRLKGLHPHHPEMLQMATVEWGERLVVDGHADIARITVKPYRPGMDVSVNPRVGIDPEIGE